MIGGRKGHPGPKMTRAEAVPAVRTKTSNKVPIIDFRITNGTFGLFLLSYGV
jgi:hypothetical protein